MQKYGQMANRVAEPDFACQVCNESAGFNWSDLHGEGMCNRCGTPYNIKEKPHQINIREEWIPVFKTYWEETREYMGMGQIVVWRDYPECERGRRKFYEWLDEHPDLVPEKEAT